MIIAKFKAARQGNRLNKNQDVWILRDYGNHMMIAYKFRGKGRMVTGDIDKTSSLIDRIRIVDVPDEFGERMFAKCFSGGSHILASDHYNYYRAINGPYRKLTTIAPKVESWGEQLKANSNE